MVEVFMAVDSHVIATQGGSGLDRNNGNRSGRINAEENS